MTSQLSLPQPAELQSHAAQHQGIVELPIAGAWLYVPRMHADGRGSFHECFQSERITQQLGYPFDVAQGNLSHSNQGVVRGIHLAEVPPGQAKFVMCAAGNIRDVLVDLRRGSPTYGKHVALELSAANGWAVHIPIGVGHGFAARSPQASVLYLVNEAYNPRREFAVNPFDAQLNIDWGVGEAEAVLSDKDRTAPALADAQQRLTTWREARGWEQELKEQWGAALAEADTEAQAEE